MNGTGMVVWDAVFGSWVGWNERDRRRCDGWCACQRALADVLVDGEWTPLVDATPAAMPRVCTSRGSDARRRRCGRWSTAATIDFAGPVLDVDGDGSAVLRRHRRSTAGLAGRRVVVPARGIAGVLARRR